MYIIVYCARIHTSKLVIYLENENSSSVCDSYVICIAIMCVFLISNTELFVFTV